MAKVIGIHRLALKPGVNGADFEEVMKKKVFTGLDLVIQLDKTITHDFTMAGWGHSEHSLMRSTEHNGSQIVVSVLNWNVLSRRSVCAAC